MKSVLPLHLLCAFLFSVLVLPDNSSAQTFFYKNYRASLMYQPYSGIKLVESDSGNLALNYSWIDNGIDQGGLLKIDSAGNILFTKRFDSNTIPGMSPVKFRGMAECPDHSVIVTGEYYLGIPGQFNGFILNILPDGSTTWSRSPSGGMNRNYEDIVRTGDKYVVRARFTSSAPVQQLIRINKFGALLHSAVLSDPSNHPLTISSMSELPNEGLIVSGYHNNSFLAEVDSNLHTIRGLQIGAYYSITNAKKSQNGGMIFMASESAPPYSHRMTLVRTDSLLNITQTTSFTSSLNYITGKLIHENPDQSVYCFFTWVPNGGSVDDYYGMIVHLDATGNVVDVKDSLEIRSFDDFIVSSDHRFCTLVTAGTSVDYRPALLVTDSAFSQLNNNQFCLEGKTTGFNVTHPTLVASSYLPISTDTNYTMTFSSIFVFGTSTQENDCITLGTNEIADATATVFPNPSKGKFEVRLNGKISGECSWRIYNAAGQLAKDGRGLVKDGSVQLEFLDGTAGVYFLEVKTDRERFIGRLLME